MTERQIPAVRLHEFLSYDPETGALAWRVSVGTCKRGGVAGYSDKEGYRRIHILGQDWPAHSVIWCMMTGEWPAKTVDHKDRQPGNNKWTNLRLATPAQQQQNQTLQRNNKSGHRGVFWGKASSRWIARIGVNGRSKHLGEFNSLEEASAAYERAAREHFGEFYVAPQNPFAAHLTEPKP